MPSSDQRFDTRIIHAGQSVDPATGALTTSVVRSAPFVFESIDVLEQYSTKVLEHYEYARTTSPTAKVVEAKLASLDGGEEAIVVASGMAAVTCVFLACLGQGDHLILTDNGYKRTWRFATDTLPKWGIEVDMVDARRYRESVREAVRPNTKLIFTEVPSNPNLFVMDIAELAAIAHDAGALLAVDATIASPVNLRPLEHGADLVIHSATKYLGGHNDLVAGAIIGSKAVIDPVREVQINLGATLDPEGAYLLLRGIKTLGVRVARQNATAQRIAEWLEARDDVTAVYYPGLPSHPDHEVAARIMDGFGGMLSFEVRSDVAGCGRFIEALEIIAFAPSLGGVESLIIHPGITVRHDLTPEQQRQYGYTDELLRLAVGLEDPDDLIADLERGFAAMRG